MNNSRTINRKSAKGKCLSLACFMMLFSVFRASVSQVHGQATSPPDSAATTSLYGRVALEGRPARSLSDHWFVWICVQFKENLKFLPPRQSNRDLYCYKVQPGPQVRLIFWNIGYDRMATPWFSANDPYALAVPTVELSRHNRHRKVASAAEWAQELDGQLGLAKATRSYDIFAWNLAEAAYAAHNDPALRAALDRYGTSVQSQAGMPADFRNTQALYASIIAQNGGGASVNEQAVFSLAQAQGAFHDTYAGIRAAAIACLADVDARAGLEPALKTKLVDFLRSQTGNSSALMFRPATSALIRVGTPADRQRIIDDVHSEDPERAEAAIVAVRRANVAGGRQAIDDVARDEGADPDVRFTATAAMDQAPADQGLPSPPAPAQRRYILRDGNLMAGFEMHTITRQEMKPWLQKASDGSLELDYPANQEYGLLQIMVSQPDAQRHTIDASSYTDLVVELKSAEPGKSVDIGVKGFDDPITKTLDKKTLSNVSTDYQLYHFPLTERDAERQQRLGTLKIVTELAFGGAEAQQFFVRNVYFTRP